MQGYTAGPEDVGAADMGGADMGGSAVADVHVHQGKPPLLIRSDS